jgi:hypothetical protein
VGQHPVTDTACAGPRLSVVLVTDVYDTVRPVVLALQRQCIAHAIEPVIVMPALAHDGIRREELRGFADPQIVAVDGVDQLARARETGIRAASAPIVFLGETHTYAEAGWAKALLARFEEPWTVVVPAVGNANPYTAASWAAYIFDYARWGPSRPDGEMSDPLVYNAAYRRAPLLAFDRNLPKALDPRQEVMWPLLWASGHRAVFVPAARILHLNVDRLDWLLQEKFSSGAVLGMHRARRWPYWRRFLYVLGSPLIPVVLLARLMRDARPSVPMKDLPAGTLAAVVLCSLARTLGEVVGYLGLDLQARDAHLTHMEIHKARYADCGVKPLA